jgi:hypothetical protein
MDEMALDTSDALSTEGLSADGTAAREKLWAYMLDHSVPPALFRPDMTVWAADLAHDGSEILFRLDTSELAAQGYTTPHLMIGDTRVDLDPVSTAHAGWNTYALTDLNGRTCLFQYLPYSSTGTAFFQYNLYDVSGGALRLAEHGEVEFSAGMPYAAPDNDVDAVMAFVDRVNDLWARSRLLLTTDGDVLRQLGYGAQPYVIFAQPADVGFRENLSVLDRELASRI